MKNVSDTIQISDVEKSLIINNGWLTDRIIDAAQSLLRNQYSEKICGLDTPLLSQKKSGFDAAGYQCLQIHYDENRNHWFTSSSVNMRIEVADSIPYTKKLTESTKHQLKTRYSSLVNDDGYLQVYIIPCDQQPNGNDCGLYAIANAIEFLVDNPSNHQYDNSKMRQHLIQCFEVGVLSSFPKLCRRGKRAVETIITVKL